jgi:flagellar hook-length control protein FliK
VVSQYRVNSEDDDGNYFSIDDQLLWETMKVMKRGKTISYSSYKNKEKTKSESDLEKQLSELYANNGNETEIQDTESKLRQLREKQIKGIMTRAKAKWGMEGEKCSRYFCNLEKRNFVGKTIPNLTLDDGRVIEDIKLILSEQKNITNTYIPVNKR